MRVLLATSEIHPLVQTGGLAHVCGALPLELGRLGAEVRVALPAYESVLDKVRHPRVVSELGEILGVAPARLLCAQLADTGLEVYLVDCQPLFRRPGKPYQGPDGADWPDNDLRFAVFCHAAARIALEGVRGWKPDVVHCHDWHTGLVPYLVGGAGAARPRTVFTIHNAAFQGNFPLASAPRLGLPQEILDADGVEFYGQLSFLKAGIRFADRLTTVSPTYARELLTPEFGCGMEGVIATRANDFIGILNGIDTTLWNPATDGFIAERYTSGKPQGKDLCKVELQRENGLDEDTHAPLVSFASRLTSQKMADVTMEHLPQMLERHPRMQFALVGSGERALEEGFASLARRFPRRVSVRIGYSEASEHRLHAGADILLHGSRFEPCGLAQMYAMRYGALPVVRRIGGLADTVTDEKTGFVFEEPTPEAMGGALERCISEYEQRPDNWRNLQERAMESELGWGRAAKAYLNVYRPARAAAAAVNG